MAAGGAGVGSAELRRVRTAKPDKHQSQSQARLGRAKDLRGGISNGSRSTGPGLDGFNGMEGTGSMRKIWQHASDLS